MSVDSALHLAGFAFVLAIWFAAILGLAQICRLVCALLRNDGAEQSRATARSSAATFKPTPRMA